MTITWPAPVRPSCPDFQAAVGFAFGFGDLPVVPSVALGSGEVTLSAITAAYGAFANKGAVYPPTVIRRMTDAEGNLLFEGKELPHQAIRLEPLALEPFALGDAAEWFDAEWQNLHAVINQAAALGLSALAAELAIRSSAFCDLRARFAMGDKLPATAIVVPPAPRWAPSSRGRVGSETSSTRRPSPER